MSAELVEQTRREKIKIFRYHSKTRRRRKKGHRQEVSIVKILEIK
ncbi:bL21 family ribosomal protein [Candidatus Giovannonibacteria bacterium]|nr:bL21 family ribosomal protein [Candidatus Giovannonibacteria bacterium]